METIYDILKAEHRQVSDLIQQAMRDGSKETFFKVKLRPILIYREKRNSFIHYLKKKKI